MCRIENIEKPLGKLRCFFGFFAIIEAQMMIPDATIPAAENRAWSIAGPAAIFST